MLTAVPSAGRLGPADAVVAKACAGSDQSLQLLFSLRTTRGDDGAARGS